MLAASLLAGSLATPFVGHAARPLPAAPTRGLAVRSTGDLGTDGPVRGSALTPALPRLGWPGADDAPANVDTATNAAAAADAAQAGNAAAAADAAQAGNAAAAADAAQAGNAAAAADAAQAGNAAAAADAAQAGNAAAAADAAPADAANAAVATPAAQAAHAAPAATGAIEIAPAASLGGGPGVVTANSFAGLTDVDNVGSTADCVGLTQRPCGEPADPWVGVGPGHVLQVVNWRVRVTSRTGGSPAGYTAPVGRSTEGWFANAPISAGRAPFNTDARVLYDREHGRWIASNLSFDCTGSVLTMMVSNDPGGSPVPLNSTRWIRYRIAFPGEVADFPTLGASSGLVAIGANRYPVSCFDPGDGSLAIQPVFGSFRRASLLVFDWSALLAGGAGLPYVDLGPTLDPGASPTLFTFAPARQTTASSQLHVVVAAKATPTAALPLGVGYLVVTGAVGDGAATSTIASTALTLVDGVSLSRPPQPVDPGGTLTQAVDFRITDGVWRRDPSGGPGRLAFASSVTSGGASPRPRARVVELATADAGAASTPTLAQVLTIEPAAGATDTFMPGVAYATDGTLWAVESQSGRGAFISTWAHRQLSADRAAVPADAQFSPGAAQLAAGRDGYAGINRRWGDSVGVAADPLAGNEGSAWQAAAFADRLEGWATFVARLADDRTPPAAPATLSHAFWAGHAVTTASVPIIFSWSAASDPQSDVQRYEVQHWVGGAWKSLALASPRAQSVRVSLAYGVASRFQVRTVDNAGNVGDWRVGPLLTPTIVRPWVSLGFAFTRATSWVWRPCATCLLPQEKRSRRAGARATLTMRGRAFAWVTILGPTRGSARVRMDGSLLRTVSAHAATITTRRLIAAHSFASVGLHRFSVEVVGTRGHPRVDIDAFIVLR